MFARKNIIVTLVICTIFVQVSYAKTILRLATGSSTGVYYPVGLGIKDVVEKRFPEIEIEVIFGENCGSLGNSKRFLLDNNDPNHIHLALVQSDIAHHFVNGTGAFSMPSSKMLGVASLYSEFVHILARKNERIKSLGDFKGLTIRTGAPGRVGRSIANTILGCSGLESSDIDDVKCSFGKSQDMLLNDSLDVAFLTAGIPAPLISSKLRSKVSFIPIPPQLASDLMKSSPYLVYSPIPKGTYGLDKDVQTVAVRALLVAHKDVKKEIVKKIIAAIFEDSQTIAERNPSGNQIALGSAEDGMTFDLHPGAKEYFNEKVLLKKILEWKSEISNLFFIVMLLVLLVVYRRFTPKTIRRNMYVELTLIFICFYLILTVIMFICEQHEGNKHFKDMYGALWSTICYLMGGFGDRPPVSRPGKFISVFVFILSLGFGAAITAMLATTFIRKGKYKMPRDIKRHITICNWSNQGGRIISELHSPEAGPELEIVVISDGEINEQELRKSPEYNNVYFVKSDPSLHSVLKASKIHRSRSVIILADDKSADPDSKSAMVALAIRALCSSDQKLHIVAEVVNHRRVPHLKDAGVDEVICAADYGLGVLAQCALQAKLSDVYNDLLRYSADTNEIYIVGGDKFPRSFIGKTFDQCANILNANRISNNPVILLGLKRDGNVFLNPRETPKGDVIGEIKEGDSLVVMSFQAPDLACL